MPRGQTSDDGMTRVAPNGYHYIKVDGKWRLRHHVEMEKILGRPLAEDERVHFVTGDKTDWSERNLRLVKQGKASVRRRLAQIEARIAELTAEANLLRAEIGKTHTDPSVPTRAERAAAH